ncbi:MAG: fumarate hydratase, partial [Clostridia bacterium]|nr:fumarate hydratase [Clostridia bacterium]
RVNETGIGPQGFGGETTALSVAIEACGTHIAGLPVAVNVGCHVTRHASCIL